MFLLGLLYVVFIVVLLQAGAGLITVVVVMGGLSLGQLFLSDKLALSAMGAKVVSPRGGAGPARDDRAALHPGRPAEAEASRWPTRTCRTRSPWAGRQKSATVCATTGIMQHALARASSRA